MKKPFKLTVVSYLVMVTERTRREFICDIVIGAGTLALSRMAHAEEFMLPDVKVYTEQCSERRLSVYYGKPLLLYYWTDFYDSYKEIPMVNKLASLILVLGLYQDIPGYVCNASKFSQIKEGPPMVFSNVSLMREADLQLNAFYEKQIGLCIMLPTFFVLDRTGGVMHTQYGRLTEENNYAQLLEKVSAAAKN